MKCCTIWKCVSITIFHDGVGRAVPVETTLHIMLNHVVHPTDLKVKQAFKVNNWFIKVTFTRNPEPIEQRSWGSGLRVNDLYKPIIHFKCLLGVYLFMNKDWLWVTIGRMSAYNRKPQPMLVHEKINPTHQKEQTFGFKFLIHD